MRNFISRSFALTIAVISLHVATAQTRTNTDQLRKASADQAEKQKLLYARLQLLAKAKGWPMVMEKKDGTIALLVNIDDLGLPIYITPENNTTAAATIGTNKLWPGGSLGLTLSGASNNVKDKIAVWDEGVVLSSHIELTGRINQKDAGALSNHATHVAGTMVASGVNPAAKGMSFGQQELIAFTFANDDAEIFGEAPSLLLSNHSYGAIAGWYQNSSESNRWEFRGNFDANEDYKFGYYDSKAQLWDSIAYNAPYYLIVKSAGNNRSENGPAVGQPYWRYNSSGVMAAAGNRPAGISSNDSYDIISMYGTAKNILTVGAVNPLPAGYTQASDVLMSSFSSWGPTDDGRIKPDVVADGVGVLSSWASGDNQYSVQQGTSMATPSVSGSLLLLQEYYSQLHGGAFMRSATLKGLTIHTTDEAGSNAGPDYQFGWGLVNIAKAATVIASNNTTHVINENTLNNGATVSIPVIASGNGTLSATICWTDPKGTPVPVISALNNPEIKLVNDLDMVIKRGTDIYRPWILDPTFPAGAATKGNNIRDNVEKIELTDVVPGAAYTIEITHKGTLERGSQAYSLITSGVGGTAYCSSNPTSNAGAKIDSVSFANIQNKNASGCTTYSNFTSLLANLQPGQTLPIFIRLRSCDATSANKIVKVFIDANNDGDFIDAGENIATSNAINGDGDYSANITIPAGLTTGKYTILRIVMQETATASDVNPCGTYTRGETQDYRAYITAPSTDVGITELISPNASDCSSAEQYVTVRIRNFGTTTKSNIPVTVIVKQGAATVATINDVFKGSLGPGSSTEYTLQTPFTSAGATAYTLTCSTNLAGDQSSSNDQIVISVTTRANAADPTGSAVLCGSTTLLKANVVTGFENFNWYTSSTAPTPVATGSNTNTTVDAPTFYLSNNSGGKLGPANKLVFPQGAYNFYANNHVRITAYAPVTLKTARLYIGTPGQITFELRQIFNYNETNGNYNYIPISSKTIEVYATAPTPPALGAPNNDPADGGAIYYLGIDIPAAGDYMIVVQCIGGASIFANTQIAANPYPFTITDLVSIVGNRTILAGNPNYYQQFYYFFYDINTRSVSCPSNRVPIVRTTAPVPTITVAGNALTSSAATSYQWYLNNSAIPGASGQTYNAVQSGSYTVQTTDANGCSLTSAAVNVTVTAIPNIDPAEIGLIVSPNPARGSMNIKLETRTKADMDIALINATGQRVYHSTIPGFIGRLSTSVNTTKMNGGIYYLQIIHDNKMYIQKVVIIQ